MTGGITPESMAGKPSVESTSQKSHQHSRREIFRNHSEIGTPFVSPNSVLSTMATIIIFEMFSEASDNVTSQSNGVSDGIPIPPVWQIWL